MVKIIVDGGAGMTGRQFGQYRLEALIGVGGMGEVFRAYDTLRNRSVAVKLLSSTLSSDYTYQRRFRRESHIVAAFREPHIIPIHDFGEIEGRLFIDMRLVDGESINSLLKKYGPIAPDRAVHLIGQVAEALEAAHADGLVHRDIKPSNVLVTESDFVYVVDFGIAHAMDAASTARSGTGILGTLDYMAPERFKNHHVDGRADVYSLTCLLYECMTAYRPFPGRDLPSLMYAHIFSPPPQPSQVNPNLPVEFDAVIAHGMAKDPDARFDTATELADAAKAALAHAHTSADILPQLPSHATATVARRRRTKNVLITGSAAVAVSIALVSAISSALGRQESGNAPAGGAIELSPAAPIAASTAPPAGALTPIETTVAATPDCDIIVSQNFTTGSIIVAPTDIIHHPSSGQICVGETYSTGLSR